MSSPYYIESGAFVRLRDGSKAEIYSVNNCEPFSVHGRVFTLEGTMLQSWTSNGRSSAAVIDLPYDIVDYWVKNPDYSKLWPLLPPWINWLARDKAGGLFGYCKKPTRNGYAWGNGRGYLPIPPEYCPPSVGDWKDSLQERPTP